MRLDEVALFLDLDGTLTPIVPRPQDVKAEPRRTALIERLNRDLGGRLAILSGRTIAELDDILERRAPSLAGVHGLVRRGADGELVRTEPHPALPEAAAGLRRAAEADGGLLVEDKGVSVALHYRLAPGHAAMAERTARDIAAATGLSLQAGDMVMELRTPGPTKGDSLRAFMSRPPFAGAVPVFVGDDLTDEDGFAAARALGGFGVLVGPPRPTAAQHRLPDVAAVIDWLEAAR